MMGYQWIVPLGAALGNLGLGTLVLVKGRGSLRPAFVFMAATLILWNVDIFGLYFFQDADLALQWARIFRVGPILAPSAVVAFAYLFADRDDRRLRWGMYLSIALALVLIVANAFDLLVAGVQRLGWGFYPVGTRLYNLLSFHFVFALAYATVTLVWELRWSGFPRKRLQARLWLLAAAVALPLGLTNLLPAYGFKVYPLGNLANVAYIAFIAFGIVRHRLMDVDLVLSKGMAYAAVSLLLVAPAFGLTIWLQRLSFNQVNPEFSAVLLALLVAVGVLFPTLRLEVESRIQRSLFPEKIRNRSALAAFARSLVRILDRDRLLTDLGSTLADTFGLRVMSIHLLEENRRMFMPRSTSGDATKNSPLPEGHPLITSLRRHHGALLRDELEVSRHEVESTEVMQTFQAHDWEVCVPLRDSSKVVGFLALGRKKSLEPFFAEDLVLLEALAAEASVALENARLYEELKRSQDIISRADRLSALGTLAAGIAHEIRNPLVAIQTFFQLAPDRLADEEFFTSFLSMTSNEVKRISDLITELLSFARSPTRSLALLNLNDTVDRVVTLLDPEARKHRLKLRRDLASDLPSVLADADQIKQVLINLVLNAIQATQAGGAVTVTSRPLRHKDVPGAQLEITDTGVGMARDQLDHIFDPFFTTKDKGTGLGLAIVHQIVREHGGTIVVNSCPGGGTTFLIDLPGAPSAPITTRSDAIIADNAAAYEDLAKRSA